MPEHSFKTSLKAPPCQAPWAWERRVLGRGRVVVMTEPETSPLLNVARHISNADLVKNYLDAEVKALAVLKDFAGKRAKLEREFTEKAKKLAASAIRDLKATEPSSQSGIYNACEAFALHIEKEANMLEKRSERTTSLCAVDLGNLVASKTAVRDEYYRSRDRVEKTRDESMTNIVAKKKQYDKLASKVAAAEKKRAGKKKAADKAKADKKVDEAVQELVSGHNEYIAAVAGNTELISRYNTTLLPNVLESIDELEKFLVADVKAVLKNMADAVDPLSAEYSEYRDDLGLLQERVDTLNGAEEYMPLCIDGEEYTKLFEPMDFKFNEALVEQANDMPGLETGECVVTKAIKQTETEKRDGLSTDINDFQKQIDDTERAIQQLADSPSDLNKPEQDDAKRAEQVRAYTALRDQVCKKAELECRMAVLDTKRARLAAGLDSYVEGPDEPDTPPARPPKSLRKRSSAPSPSPSPSAASPVSPAGGANGGGGAGADSGDLFDQSWYHGILARSKVNELLKDNPNCQPGDFLVRESARDPDQLVLSVFVSPKISHFKITKDEAGKYSFEGDSFGTVTELVNYHHNGGHILTHKSQAVVRRGVERTQRPFTAADVELGEKLGKGNFGDVYKGVIKRTGQEVAVKTCRDTVTNPERFLEEADTLNQYSHPNIVTLYGVVKAPPVMILLELCLGGELLKFLRNKNEKIEVGQKVKMCLEAALGMAYLHSKMCIHRDLAARNCLLTGTMPNTLKISDFGMSRVNEDDEDLYTVQTTAKTIPIRWTAPEALEHLEYHTASDVWSYGILMWEIFSGGKLPYAGFSNAQVRHEVIQNAYRLAQPDDCPDDMHAIMASTWAYDKNQRPTMASICETLEKIKKRWPYDTECC